MIANHYFDSARAHAFRSLGKIHLEDDVSPTLGECVRALLKVDRLLPGQRLEIYRLIEKYGGQAEDKPKELENGSAVVMFPSGTARMFVSELSSRQPRMQWITPVRKAPRQNRLTQSLETTVCS